MFLEIRYIFLKLETILFPMLEVGIAFVIHQYCLNILNEIITLTDIPCVSVFSITIRNKWYICCRSTSHHGWYSYCVWKNDISWSLLPSVPAEASCSRYWDDIRAGLWRATFVTKIMKKNFVHLTSINVIRDENVVNLRYNKISRNITHMSTLLLRPIDNISSFLRC